VLDSIRLQNFKTHRDTEIKLGRLTVLVGPNGSGKSSVLRAIELLGELTRTGFKKATVLAAMRTAARGQQKLEACALHIQGHRGDSHRWSWSMSETGASTPSVAVEVLASELSATSLALALNPRRLAEPVPLSQLEPQLASDGFGLAEVVATMRLADDERFDALQAAVRAVVPQVERIGVRRTKIIQQKYVVGDTPDGPEAFAQDDPRIGHELTFDVSGRKNIPASMMSSGTMITVGILTVLYSSARPRILLIDDIDHGLHPRAQWDLLKQLRRLLTQFPHLQIVATSHSPDLVDELEPDEVVVLALREDGTSAAKPLTECPREDMLGVLKAGQLWSAIGEDWVKAADPVEPAP